jgi:hypothetical protein
MNDEQTNFVPDITLTAAMSEPTLFGKIFAAPSFWPWRTLAKLIDGEPLTEPREIELFEQCSGRKYNREARHAVRRLILLAGRRAGKDRFLSAVAVWRCALCTDWRKYISPGEQAVVILLGADKKQASILRRYCQGLLQVPLLAREVVRTTGEVTEFRNGSSLEIATNDARLVRGRSAIAVLGSECCHWKTSETAASSDEEVVGAAEPSMAMCPDTGLLLLGSSVYRRRGYMFRKWKELYGNAEAEDICWFAPSPVMNPLLRQSVIDRALAEDARKAAAEYLGVWREDLSDLYPPDAIEASTDFKVYERMPVPGVTYRAFADAAGGTGSDAYGFAISHREIGTEKIAKLDVLREYRPRFVPAQVIAELAKLCKLYNISEVQGAKFAGGFHADEWQRHGIRFKPCENTTSENYLHLLPMLLSGRARLLDNATLRSQLAGLERKMTASGYETVTHMQVSSAHDDMSCAAAGALVASGHGYTYDSQYRAWDPDYVEPDRSPAPQQPSSEPPPIQANANWWQRGDWERKQQAQQRPAADQCLLDLYGAIDMGLK